MSSVIISALPTGTPQGTDLTPATDTTDTSEAPAGTTKKYTRSSEFNFVVGALGVVVKTACLLTTTANLNATYNNGTLGVGATLTNAGTMAVFASDGVTPAINSRVLVKDQGTQANNGIYTLTTVGSASTNWVLTRATDYDQAADVNQYDMVLVNQGTLYAGKSFQETGAGAFVIGTTPIIFSAYSLLPTGTVTFPLAMAYGGTGAALTPANGGIIYSNASTLSILAPTATANQIVMSGSLTLPHWSTAVYPATTTINQLLYSSAGNNITGLATANSAMLITTGTGVPGFTTSMTNGQIIIGSTGATPVLTTLTAGAGISISNTAGAITISVGGGGTTWTEVTGTSQTMSSNNGYVTNNAGLVTLTLPAASALGDILDIQGKGSGGWSIVYGTNQLINIGNVASTITTGSVSSTDAHDSMELVCITANLEWAVLGGVQGTVTIV